MHKDSRIFVAGHRGLVGSAITDELKRQGFANIITRTKNELNLLDSQQVENFFTTYKPEFVFLAAAKVGGILANNTYRADFIYENLTIQNNIVINSYKIGVKKLLFLGSSCIYPKDSPQPIKENYLLTKELEYTNEPYAIAKIAGIKMCESFNLQYNTNFISIMPTNLYGNNDNFNLLNSHVLPALIRKIHLAKLLSDKNEDMVYKDLMRDCATNEDEAKAILRKFQIDAKSVGVWGSGKPRREFLHNQDMARASVFVMQHVDFCDLIDSHEVRNTHINVGYGKDISIFDLANLVQEIVGFDGEIVFDSSKPDGTFQKLMDSSKLQSFGFQPQISLRDGIKSVYQHYLKQYS
ncbi:GDP-L-fucose synthase [Helicobacter didelphidarum]|uniref:GDP-L-fucose synthase n=1 Tax=Helicobacter didelphidarum TaxID=2040648 RepID=A0A3D8IRF0_9HELI|nr:GDP-L-fucose synthase [Helicobacter didelphidarum]RDU67171.1 GDP-L-fucose synthase [Helicobacter didelphidarum]